MAADEATPLPSTTSFDTPNNRQTREDLHQEEIRKALAKGVHHESDPAMKKKMRTDFAALISSQSLPPILVSEEAYIPEGNATAKASSATTPVTAPNPQRRPDLPIWLYILVGIAGILVGTILRNVYNWP